MKSEVSKITDWIQPRVSESIKNKVKEQISKIYNNLNKKETLNIKLKKKALKGYMKSYRINGNVQMNYVNTFLNKNKNDVSNFIKLQQKSIKFK